MGYVRRADGAGPTSSEVSWLISNACRLDERSFRVVILLLACFASLASFGRLIISKRYNIGLHLDGKLVIFGTMCLLIETGCVYHYTSTLYIVDASAFNTTVNAWLQNNLDSTFYQTLSTFRPTWIFVNYTFAWISISSIKFSLLALFHEAARNVSKTLRITFWSTLGATVASGATIFALLFTQCPHFNQDAGECLMRESRILMLSIVIVEQFLNISTTLMIACVFVVLLQSSPIRLCRNLSVGTVIVIFLGCICVSLGIMRAAGGMHRNIKGVEQPGVVWNSLILHCEASITVIVGSIALFFPMHTTCRGIYATEDPEASASISTRFKSALILPTIAALRLLPDTRSTTANEQPICRSPPKQDLATPRRSEDSSRCSLDRSEFRSATSIDIADEGRRHIRVTIECTVTSEEASVSELERAREDIVSREWDWQGDPETCSVRQSGSARVGAVAELDPAHFGMIASGLR